MEIQQSLGRLGVLIQGYASSPLQRRERQNQPLPPREEDKAGTNLVDHLVGSRDDNPARQARQDEGEEVIGSNGLVSAVAQSQGLLL